MAPAEPKRQGRWWRRRWSYWDVERGLLSFPATLCTLIACEHTSQRGTRDRPRQLTISFPFHVLCPIPGTVPPFSTVHPAYTHKTRPFRHIASTRKDYAPSFQRESSILLHRPPLHYHRTLVRKLILELSSSIHRAETVDEELWSSDKF